MMGRLWTLVFKLGIRCRTTITKLTYTGTFQYNYYKVMTHIPLGKEQSILNASITGLTLRLQNASKAQQ